VGACTLLSPDLNKYCCRIQIFYACSHTMHITPQAQQTDIHVYKMHNVKAIIGTMLRALVVATDIYRKTNDVFLVESYNKQMGPHTATAIVFLLFGFWCLWHKAMPKYLTQINILSIYLGHLEKPVEHEENELFSLLQDS
ncbi:hypothetical protein ACJX0J_021146, partial [Zea mays]